MGAKLNQKPKAQSLSDTVIEISHEDKGAEKVSELTVEVLKKWTLLLLRDLLFMNIFANLEE